MSLVGLDHKRILTSAIFFFLSVILGSFLNVMYLFNIRRKILLNRDKKKIRSSSNRAINWHIILTISSITPTPLNSLVSSILHDL